MPNQFDEERITDLIDEYLQHLEGEGREPDLSGLDPELQAAARRAFRAADAAWRSETDIPSFREDPVAIALGFVKPHASDQSITLVGLSITSARKRRGLKAAQLAGQLRSVGLDVSTNWLFTIEGAKAMDVSESTAAALAKVLQVEVETLSISGANELDEFTAWLYSDDFGAEVASWLSRQDSETPVDYLAVKARSRLLVAAKRSGGEGSRAQWIAMLHAVLQDLL
jgi:transcriptional regulator with XRE-family HTH domain